MSLTRPVGATIPEVDHHEVDLNGASLHYVSAGRSGSPILLLHGWPETWWAFRKVIPLLAPGHRVFAVDLRGFGDSDAGAERYGEAVSVGDLDALVAHLGVGPVHLLCQDVSGGIGVRFASEHPEAVLSLTGVETTLAGYGLEALADVNHGGAWHLGFFGAPGIASMLLPGRERELLAGYAYPLMSATPGAVSPADLEEFIRAYSRPDAWRGSEGLYGALFTDGGATRSRLDAHPLSMPVLAIDAVSHPFTATTFSQIAVGEVRAVRLEGVGHLVAQEAPEALADALLAFVDEVDAGR
jgi:pimeloyl-ACP methyl ester carboxylesterase